MGEQSGIEIRLLDGVRILQQPAAGAQIVHEPSPVAQRLLAILGLAEGRVVTVARLIRLSYDDDRRDDNVISQTVTEVNELLDYAIRFENDGYRLVDIATDVGKFRAECKKARSATDAEVAYKHAASALSLFTGSPLAIKWRRTSTFLQSSASELQSERDDMVELLVEGLCSVGNTSEALTCANREGEHLWQRERFSAAVAVALANEGRSDEALDKIQKHRAARVEKGLLISPQINELEHEIAGASLGGRDLLQLHVTPPIADSTEDHPFIGRKEALSSLRSVIAANGSVLVTGVGGIGKSTLLERVAAEETASGRHVVRVVANTNPVRPFDPIVSILERVEDLIPGCAAHLDELDQSVVEHLLGRESDHLAVGLDQLDQRAPYCLASIGSIHNILYVIDDAQNLDQVSIKIVKHLAASGTCPLVLAAKKDKKSSAKFAKLLGASKHLSLPLLKVDDVSDYVSKIFGRPVSGQLAKKIEKKSGGNPLFLRMLVEHAKEGVDIDNLPPKDLDKFTTRLDIDSKSYNVLARAAAMQDGFDVKILRDVWPALDIDDAIRLAARGGLVEFDDFTGEGRFVHGIIQDAAFDHLDQDRQNNVNGQLARHMTAVGKSAVETLHHYAAARSWFEKHGQPGEVAQANLRAGMEYLDSGALERAIECCDVGLDSIPGPGEGKFKRHRELWVELMVRRGAAERLLALPQHVETLMDAVEAASGLAESRLVAYAARELCDHGGTTKAGENDERAREVIEKVLAMRLEPTHRAPLLAATAKFYALSDLYERGQTNFKEAVGILDEQEIDDREIVASVYVNTHLGLSRPGIDKDTGNDDLDDRDIAIKKLRSVAGQSDDLRWEVALLRFWQAFRRAEVKRMDAALKTMEALTPRARHRELGTVHTRAAHAHIHNQLGQARGHLDDAAKLAAEMGVAHSWITAMHSGLAFAIEDSRKPDGDDDRRDTLSRMGAMVDDFVKDLPEFHNWQAGKALFAFLNGKEETARSVFEGLAQQNFGLLSRDVSWTAAISVAARVAHLLDDEPRARVLFDLLYPFKNQMSWAGTCTFGPNAWALGLLAKTTGDEASEKELEKISKKLFKRFGTAPPHFI